MPAWLLSVLLPLAISIIENYGIPALETKWPALIPLLSEAMLILGGKAPTPPVHAAALAYNTSQTPPAPTAA